MPTEPTNTMKYILIGVILFFAGGVVSMFSDPYLPASLSNTQKGFSAARTLVENSSLGDFFKITDDVRSIAGKVTAVNGNRISITSAVTNPFDTEMLSEHTVIVGADTKVTRLVVTKLSTAAHDQLAKFLKITSPSLTNTQIEQVIAQQPLSPVEQSVNVSDIKVGDSVSVTSSENIKTAKEFTATGIQLQSKAQAK